MTDERYKTIMADLGMPDSRSLLEALRQVANEVAQAAALAERERICAAIKAEDDHCSTGDYMLDSDDCISVARGTWKRSDCEVRPNAEFSGRVSGPLE